MASPWRRQAATALRVVTSTAEWSDEELAAALGSEAEGLEAFGYLTGFVVQVLALHRAEDVAETARFLRHLLEEGGGPSGVREPRRPTPSSDTGHAR